MFLKPIKQKIYKNHINKLLNHIPTETNTDKIKSIGVLLMHPQRDIITLFDSFFNRLKITTPHYNYKIFTDPKNENLENSETYFSHKAFSWLGKIKHKHLNSFVNKDFDLLISYYKLPCLELDLLTAMCKAKFKVGLSIQDERLYDLIIDTKPEQFAIFENELIKYLTILNKL